ncbi:MAG: signal peptidase I [Bacilli bacterium]
MTEEKKIEKVKEEKGFFREILPYVIILIIVIIIRAYIATPVRVSGPSMQPTLKNKEMLILNKRGNLERFKIVVIKTDRDHLIKRIIALPGEKIEVVNNELYINDEFVEDNYGDGVTKDFGPIELGDNEYFVMGDNREDSTDSRILGPIKEEKIMGTVGFRIFPFTKIGNIDKN